jgi:hypothetical protein
MMRLPLLHDDPEYLEFQRQQAKSSSCLTRFKSCAFYFSIGLLLTIVFFAITLKLYFFQGATHGAPTLSNSTATEPNTGIDFPLHFRPQHTQRIDSLIGVDAWEYVIPVPPLNPKLIIGAIGFYIERAEGKRKLYRFRNVPITLENYQDIVQVLMNDAGLGQVLRIVLTTNPPKHRMLQWWDEQTKVFRNKYCGENKGEEAFAEFSSFFGKRPFVKGDDLSFERRGGGFFRFVR